MDIHSINSNPNPDQDPRKKDGNSGAVDPFEAARRRLQGPRSRISRNAQGGRDPQAIRRLPIRDNPVTRYMRHRNARPATVRSYWRKLRRTQELLIESGFQYGSASDKPESFPWHLVTPADAEAFSRLLSQKYQHFKSRENLLGVLRQLVRQCARVQLITMSEREQILECLPVRGGQLKRVGSEILNPEFVALIQAALTQRCRRVAIRDAAILAVFASTGMRASELADLTIADYDADDRSLWIAVTKTGTPRRAWLNKTAQQHVNNWLSVRGDHTGVFFESLTGGALTYNGIRLILKRLCAKAGIQRRITTHDFRRTFVTRALRMGNDPFVVARLVGHKRVTTTMVYDRRTDAEDREVVDRLDLPDLGTKRRSRRRRRRK